MAKEIRYEGPLNIVNLDRFPVFMPSPKTVYKSNIRIKSVTFERISHDEEYEKLRKQNKQIDISSPEIYVNGKKPIDGIFSPLFGADTTNDSPVYTCDCRSLVGAVHQGHICPKCGTECRSIEADLSRCGHTSIAPFHIMTYHGYNAIKTVYKNLDDIISRSVNPNREGNIISDGVPTIMDLYEIYDEEIYPYTGLEKKYAFCSHIPVISARVRPLMRAGYHISMLEINKLYMNIQYLAQQLRVTNLSTLKLTGPIQRMLNQIQQDFNRICEIVIDQINGKAGVFRKMLASGRIDYSSRMVISLGRDLAPNEVDIPYITAMRIYEELIANILHRLKNISISKAIGMVMEAQAVRDPFFVKIIEIILNSDYGVWALINRNPTINETGIEYVRVRRVHPDSEDNKDATLHLPPDILEPLGADFDGDQLTYAAVLDPKFHELFLPMCPTYAFIDRSTGYFRSAMGFKKDYAAALSRLFVIDKAVDQFLNDPDEDSHVKMLEYGIDNFQYDSDDEKEIIRLRRDKILRDVNMTPRTFKRRMWCEDETVG